MKPLKAFFLFVLTGNFSFGLSTFAIAQEANTPPPAAVETMLAVQRNIAPTMWVPGTIISRYDSKIASETSGVLKFVVEVGEYIHQGGLLAKVNDQQLSLQLRRDRASLKRLQAQLQHAETQLSRSLTLSHTNGASQSLIDEQQMQRDVLEQEVILAQVQLEQTQYLNDRTNIIAPFSGVVVERFQHTGEHIGTGEEILRLVSTDKLEVSLRAPVEASQYIQAGQTVPLKNQEKELYTTIRSVVPVGDVKSRMLEVRLHLQDKSWVIGEPVEVAVSKGPPQLATVVPRDALVLRNNAVYIFRVLDGKAEKLDVTPGIGDASDIVVVGKVQPGDIIVTRGAERLDDGREVKILDKVAGLE